jgi:creatinine amidohydrolase
MTATDWELLNWQALAERVADDPVVIVPVGCVECQGPYSPLGTEHLLAERLGRDVAADVGGLALPALPFGNSDMFRNIPGTIYIRPEVLTELYADVFRSIVRPGFSKILCLSFHIPNQPQIERAARIVADETGVQVLWVNPGSLAASYLPDLFEDPRRVRGHGAEPGLSLMRYLAGVEVPPDGEWEPERETFGAFSVNGASLRLGAVSVGGPLAWESLYPESGGFGDPHQGSVEIGEQIYARLVRDITAVARAIAE